MSLGPWTEAPGVRCRVTFYAFHVDTAVPAQ